MAQATRRWVAVMSKARCDLSTSGSDCASHGGVDGVDSSPLAMDARELAG